MWLGYYENAFRLVRECYAGARSTVADARLADSHAGPTAFRRREHASASANSTTATWLHWLARFDEDDALPGEPCAPMRRPLSPADLVERSVSLLVNFGRARCVRPHRPTHLRRPCPHAEPDAAHRPPARHDRNAGRARRCRARRRARGRCRRGQALGALPPRPTTGRRRGPLIDRRRHRPPPPRHRATACESDDAVRRIWQFIDLVGAIVRGHRRRSPPRTTRGFAAVDDVDYRDWLARHGASPDTHRVTPGPGRVRPRVRVRARRGVAASLLRRHRPAALGEALLRVPGGHLLEDDRGDGRSRVRTPARCAPGPRGPVPVLPSRRPAPAGRFRHARRRGRPRRAGAVARRPRQLRAAGRDRRSPVLAGVARAELLDASGTGSLDTLESHWSDVPDAGTLTLRDREDFDDLVLAIPVGMHPFICRELIENPRTPQWRAMSDGVSTVATQTMQLWLTEDEQTLGWSERDVTTSGYPARSTPTPRCRSSSTRSRGRSTSDRRRWPTSATCCRRARRPRRATCPIPPASSTRPPPARSSTSPTTSSTSGPTAGSTAASAGTCSPGAPPRVQPASTTSTSGPTSIRRIATSSRCREPAGSGSGPTPAGTTTSGSRVTGPTTG